MESCFEKSILIVSGAERSFHNLLTNNLNHTMICTLILGGERMGKPIEQALNECLFFSVKKLDRMLNKMADEAFKKTGLAPTYGFILLILKEKDGLPQKDIAQMLYSAPSTIARFVEKLEYKGYIKTVSDGRLSLVYLTDEGREFIKEIDSSWEELHQAYNAVLGTEVSGQLSQDLNAATDKLQKK